MAKPAKAPRAVLRQVLEEQRSRFILVYPAQNPPRILRVANLLPSAVLQCDYVVDVTSQELYIELKGSDVEHAVQQLLNTLTALRLPAPDKFFFIVHHHCPLPATKVAQLKARFRKKTGYPLYVQRSPHTHVL